MDNIISSSSIYIDANILIYYIESNPQFVQKVRDLFAHIKLVGAKPVTNEITIAECIYKPSKEGEMKAIDSYERLFESGVLAITQLDGGLAKRAAMNGGRLGLKLIDAIHYVSALEFGCDLFVTSDGHFKSGPKMAVIRIM
jgi:predicted nucleic acid-binding protein